MTINYEDLPEGMEGGQSDYPLQEVAAAAEEVAARGGIVFQKFTCAGCGNRLTMPDQNKFYTKGTCDQCGVVTNIEERGCNFLAVFPMTEKGKKAINDIAQTLSD